MHAAHGLPRVLHSANVRVWQHPAAKLSFLVGRRGRNELAAIGGAWDPADGAHPATSGSALIATAVRTFRAATGVDLSCCAQW
jgi:hypothetical protein